MGVKDGIIVALEAAEDIKKADFVVLSDNPYAELRENIREIRVEMTLVDGDIVYSAKQGK